MAYFSIAESITLILLIGLILLFTYYVHNLRTNNMFSRLGIPGPTPIPLFGELLNGILKGVRLNDIALVRQYGKIIGIFEGSTPMILLSDPDLLRKVLIKDSQIFINRQVVENASGPLDYGLPVLKDDQWKNVRAIVSPTFSTAKLKAMHNLMDPVSDLFNKQLFDYADTLEMFDAKLLCARYTLDSIASCLFGLETNSLQNENGALVNHLKKFFNLKLTSINFLIYRIVLFPQLSTYLGKKGHIVFPISAVHYTVTVVNQVLERRRQHLERRNDFIQIMVDREEEIKEEENNKQYSQNDEQQPWNNLKKTLNDREILGQALTFLVAGYETTSVLLSFFFYIMATHPVIQEKLYEEIHQELGDDEINHDRIGQLHYLDMVINETLRMYPPFIRFDRVASAPYELGGYKLAEGTIISVPVYALHHNPSVWPDPEKFIPERFLPEEKAKRHPMAFLPFGDGPRNCIGMRFALLEAKLAIAKALRVVEIQSCEKTEIPLQLTKSTMLSPENGAWIRVVRRSH